VHLTFNYPRWEVDPEVWWQYSFPLAVAGVVAISWLVRGRTRTPLTVSLLFVGTLVPALGFVNVYPFVYSYVADHFQYQASIALILPFAAGLVYVLGRRPLVARIALGGVAVLLGAITFRQSADYANVETLYRVTILRNPLSWMSYENLGVLLAQTPDRLPEAIEAFRASVRIAPHRVNGHRNLAIALSHTGDWRGAAEQYQDLLAIDETGALDHVNLARALIATGDTERAALHARFAIELDPKLADAHVVLGRVLASVDPSAAIAALRTATQLAPTSADAHLDLATLLSRQPEGLRDAAAEYRAALALRPDMFDASYNLGTLLLDIPGEADAAVAALTNAVSLKPDDPRARTNLGIALEDAGRTQEAIAQLELAVRIAPDLTEPRTLLAQLTGRR
jgi:tetratricopeptide (TPR) repeat protein